jgi:hypothetical protein
MITADVLKTLTEMGPKGLQALLGKAVDDYEFTGAKFLGMTNGGEFCYSVVYRAPSFEGTDSTKVFLNYDFTRNKISASSELTRW